MCIVLAVARVKGGDWRWRTQIVDPRAGHPPPGRRLEIEIGDWRSQLAAAGVKWEIGDWRSEMCGVNESIAHLLEGSSPPPSPAPPNRDWRLEIGDGDRRSDWIRQNMTLEIGDWRWRSEMIFYFLFFIFGPKSLRRSPRAAQPSPSSGLLEARQRRVREERPQLAGCGPAAGRSENRAASRPERLKPAPQALRAKNKKNHLRSPSPISNL